MADKIYNVLFLCTGNSARSILAESIMNKLGKGKFRGFSAGSHPKGQVHPIALESYCGNWAFRPTACVAKVGTNSRRPIARTSTSYLRSAIRPPARCAPYWPGQPMTAHWGIPDPVAVEGTDVEKSFAFREAFRAMETRIKLFLSLPLASIDRMRLKERLDAIGKTPPEPPSG